MNDRAQRNGVRLTTRALGLADKIQELRTEIEQLQIMIQFEQALRRSSEEKLAIYRRTSAPSIDFENDDVVTRAVP